MLKKFHQVIFWQDMKIVENRRQSSFNVFCFESPAFGSGFCCDNPVVFFLADLVSLSKQRFEQLGMKTHDVKAFFDKVQKLYTMKGAVRQKQ
jgi:hypothetical protein